MPEMDGIAFLEQARRLAPDVPVVLVSGTPTRFPRILSRGPRPVGARVYPTGYCVAVESYRVAPLRLRNAARAAFGDDNAMMVALKQFDRKRTRRSTDGETPPTSTAA